MEGLDQKIFEHSNFLLYPAVSLLAAELGFRLHGKINFEQEEIQQNERIDLRKARLTGALLGLAIATIQQLVKQ